MICLRSACRDYLMGTQTVHALDGVDLDVEAGEYVAITGPSGSGKSTLLHIIGLLDRLSQGSYELDGDDVTHLSDDELALVRCETIGFVFQFFHLVPRLSAAANVELPLILGGIAAGEREERVQAVLQSFGLADRADHRPDQLSGGQRQRVAIARAMVTKPAILLADEPTGNLDRSSGKEVIHILETLNSDGLTLLVVTHDPELSARANRRLHIVDGAITKDERGAG